MKKIFVVSLAIVLIALLLTGCSSQNGGTPSTPPGGSPAQPGNSEPVQPTPPPAEPPGSSAQPAPVPPTSDTAPTPVTKEWLTNASWQQLQSWSKGGGTPEEEQLQNLVLLLSTPQEGPNGDLYILGSLKVPLSEITDLGEFSQKFTTILYVYNQENSLQVKRGTVTEADEVATFPVRSVDLPKEIEDQLGPNNIWE